LSLIFGYCCLPEENFHGARVASCAGTREDLGGILTLISSGYGSLVHPKMLEHLKEHGNDPDQALNAQANLPLGPPSSEARLPNDPMTLDAMREHNEKNPGDEYRLIGPPRGLVPHPQIGVDSAPADRPLRQRTLEEGFGISDSRASGFKRTRMDEGDTEIPSSKRERVNKRI